MLYSIENSFIKIQISDIGAELQSIYNKINNTEYLWQGDEKYWTGRAYNLFPICGRLTEGKYIYNGKEYEMGLHGFVRHSLMKPTETTSDSITFELRPNDEIKAQYPFDFIFKVTYIISGYRVKTVYRVKNLGKNDMYFALGGHPGFNVPLSDGENFEDYYLEFDNVSDMELLLMSPLFFLGKTKKYPMTDGKIIELSHDLFSEDARFFTNVSPAVTLRSSKSRAFVRMEYEGFRNLGIWHKPQTEAPYICIEPWTSVPSSDGIIDKLESKNQMTRLPGGESYSLEFDIIIG